MHENFFSSSLTSGLTSGLKMASCEWVFRVIGCFAVGFGGRKCTVSTFT